MSPFTRFTAEYRPQIEETLARLVRLDGDRPSATAEAMAYAVLGGGKRLRPLLALASGKAAGGEPRELLVPAAALELIHTYSLVHDDLPAMDDDDLRRGRATTHVTFGEARAILAGDGLLTLAFETLAGHPEGGRSDSRRLAALTAVARAAGIHGMVGGQCADLEAEGRDLSFEQLRFIHNHKTAALFRASAELGAIHAGASDEILAALARFGHELGLAFQIVDDILDCTETAASLGKTPGKDAAKAKLTYPGSIGLDASKARASECTDRAIAALADGGVDDPVLVDLARSSLARTH